MLGGKEHPQIWKPSERATTYIHALTKGEFAKRTQIKRNGVSNKAVYEVWEKQTNKKKHASPKRPRYQCTKPPYEHRTFPLPPPPAQPVGIYRQINMLCKLFHPSMTLISYQNDETCFSAFQKTRSLVWTFYPLVCLGILTTTTTVLGLAWV